MTTSDELKEVRALLPLYVGGDLEPEEADRVRALLPRHPELAAELAFFEDARAALIAERAAVAEGGVDLWPRIRTAMVDEGLLGGAAGLARPVSTEFPPAPVPVAPSWPRVALRIVTGSGLIAAAVLAVMSLRGDGAEGWGPAGSAGPAGPVAQVAAEPIGIETQAMPQLAASEGLGSPAGGVEPGGVEAGAGAGLRPVLAGEPSLGDANVPVERPMWIVAPPQPQNGLAGYR